ncbi:hypothetical protein C6P44_003085 [Monosporozyma unispora]|nr:hypothetical protein C6P44_003085 [Kazachstania unispora]
MSSDISQLIQLAQSADNNERNNAETTLLHACDSDASSVLSALMAVGVNATNDQPLTSRQFALLTARKLITFYWSPAFESYRNTSSLNEQCKEFIRESLLKLCLDPEQDKKISNGASYCIVQIAAVDFPDQWPRLLEQLYAGIINTHSLNAMSVLNEIYDDVISEEMFFEGGIGMETLKIIFQLLTNPNSSLDAKTAAMKLFNASLLQMSTVTSHANHERKTFVQDVVPKSLETLLQLLQTYVNVFDQSALQLKSKIYENLALIKNDFPKKLFPHQAVVAFKQQSISDLALLKDWSVNQNQENESLWQIFNETTIQTLEFLSSVSTHASFTQEENIAILQSMLTLSCLDNATRESWIDDPNEFVSKETGLTASYTMRDQVAEYLGNLSGKTLQPTFENILEFININMSNNNTNLMESALYMLQSVLIQDDDEGLKIVSVPDFEKFIDTIFNYQLQTNDVTLSMRIILTVPKILDIFMSVLPDIKGMLKNYLSKSIELAINIMNQENDKLIMSSVLIAFTYYAYFAELPSVLGNELCLQVQSNLLKIVNHVAEDAEEDTNGLLIEVLNNIISSNTPETDFKLVRQQFTSVLSISGKDPSNIQIVVESQDCLEKLLANINTERYSAFIELCLPSFIHIIQGNKATGYKYSPLLSLILEFITVFMKKKPADGPLPAKIAEYIWEPLIQVLQKSTEDETLQLATDAFTYLIHNTETNALVSQLPAIVNILDRLLSIDVTDTAAMNVGSLIVTICNKFSNEISSLIPQILKAAVTRLIQVKNVSTQENLVSLLCFLTYNDPLQTLNFLFEMSNEENRNVVQSTFNKWFETFEIVRGERKIKDNVIALSKIYFLSDTRLNEIMVNGELIPYDGDLIITRSMAKKMPDRYTQVSVYTKIVKLFCHEIEFRTRQPDANQLITSDVKRMGEDAASNEGEHGECEKGNDDDWEDVDDVLDYEKLKEFLDEDEDDTYDDLADDEANPEQAEAQEITGIADVPQSLVQLLIEFFKEVMVKNANDFQNIYNSLSENEKAVLTQQLV